jgi:hypothetical protein
LNGLESGGSSLAKDCLWLGELISMRFGDALTQDCKFENWLKPTLRSLLTEDFWELEILSDFEFSRIGDILGKTERRL